MGCQNGLKCVGGRSFAPDPAAGAYSEPTWGTRGKEGETREEGEVREEGGQEVVDGFTRGIEEKRKGEGRRGGEGEEGADVAPSFSQWKV